MKTLIVKPQEFIPKGFVKYEITNQDVYYNYQVWVGKTIKVFGKTIASPTKYEGSGVVNLGRALEWRNYQVGLGPRVYGEIEVETLSQPQTHTKLVKCSHVSEPVIGTATVTSGDQIRIEEILSAKGRVSFAGLSLTVELG